MKLNVETSRTTTTGRKRGLSTLIALVGATALLAGCATASDAGDSSDAATTWQEVMPNMTQDIVDAAEKEGTLTLYTGTWSESTAAVVEGFNKLFPDISVEIYENSGTKLVVKFDAEQAAGTYIADVLGITDSAQFDRMADAGALMEYTVGTDAEFADGDKSTGYWYPLRRGMVGIAWNTDLVTDKEAADLDWSSVADPKWAGKMGLDDMGEGGCVISCLVWYYWDTEFGDDFVKDIAANKPAMYESASTLTEALAAGDIAVAFNASENGLTTLFDKGAPIKWVLPSPGIGQVSPQAIAANAPHPNAAKLFQEYTFSEQGYKLWQAPNGIPAWQGMAPLTEVSKESWYAVPTDVFAPEPGAADKLLPHINQVFAG